MSRRSVVGCFISAFAAVVGLSACGGGGGGGGIAPPPTGNVAVSGKATFDRPSYSASNTLDFNNLEHLPIRGATVEILKSSDQSVLATTSTAADGTYSAAVPAGSLIVRVKAQMTASGSGGYDFKILNNTSGNALYTLDSSVVSPTGSSVTVNLNAATGWSNGAYTGTRAAGPFAILDMLWRAKTLLQGAEPGLTLPALNVYWSTLNTSDTCTNTDGTQQPNPMTGAIQTTFYLDAPISAGDKCPTVPAGMYVLGDSSGNVGDDADEFDESVIAHEMGHYFQAKFSRDDSMGGSHYFDARHDLRLAYSEGWGNAFQAFVLNDPVYRDTYGTGGTSSFYFDISNHTAPYQNVAERGWFGEASVQEFLWTMDGLVGYPAIHTVMRNEMKTTDAMTSIYVMAAGLESRNPADANAIISDLASDDILGQGDFGTNEGPVGASAVNAWPADPYAVPVYNPGADQPAAFGTPISINSVNYFADPGDTLYQSYNRLGARRYLRIYLPSGFTGTLHIAAQGPVGSDPDFALYQDGVDQCPNGGACSGYDNSTSTGLEVADYNGLPAGKTYVLEVEECSYLGKAWCGAATTPFGTGNTAISVTVTQQ